MHKRTKALDISPKVKKIVWERDGGRCILCGNPSASPNAHYIPRSQSGLGIPENVVTLCVTCHMRFDNSWMRNILKQQIKSYLMDHYPQWNEKDLVYKKWRL